MKKMALSLSLVFLLVLAACGGTTEPVDEVPDDELIEMTLEELAAFDGREGRPAYVAVDGFIYDVSGSPRWSGGSHNGNQAGQDLTEIIDNVSPHGRSTLNRVPRIGRLVED